MAYRPSTGQAHKARAAETGLSGYASPGYFTDTDEACSLADGDDGQVVYWTVDRGHSWRHEKTSQLLGSSLEASTCEPAGAGPPGAHRLQRTAQSRESQRAPSSPRGINGYLKRASAACNPTLT